MTKKELEALPICEYDEEIPLLDGLYFCMTRRKHESVFKIIDIYGEKNNDENWKIKKLSFGSDVIHFRLELENINSKKISLSNLVNIDCLENNVYHVWSNSYLKFYIDHRCSDFTIILKEK